MKAAILIGTATMLLFSCGRINNGNNVAFAGKYILYGESRFGQEYDTVIITPSRGLKDEFMITQHKRRIRVTDAGDSTNVVEKTDKNSKLDKSGTVLVVTENLEEIALFHGNDSISYAGTTYVRLKE